MGVLERQAYEAAFGVAIEDVPGLVRSRLSFGVVRTFPAGDPPETAGVISLDEPLPPVEVVTETSGLHRSLGFATVRVGDEWDDWPYLLYSVTDLLQDLVTIGLFTLRAETRWPMCTDHSGRHALRVGIQDADRPRCVWVCPLTERAAAPVGRLVDRRTSAP